MRVLLSELHCPPRLMGLPTPKHLLLLLLFLTGLSPSWAADPCLTDALRRLTESGHTRVGDHTAFRTNRGIDSYKKLFGAEFEQDLDRLSSKAHWLDSGAGDAVAARELLQSRPDWGRPRVTAITLEAPSNIPRQGFDGRFSLLTGRYIEDIPDIELGQANLITDVFGPFAYADSPSKILEKYTTALASDGTIWLHGGDLLSGYFTQSLVRRADGRTTNLLRWLQEIPGLDVREIRHYGERNMLRVSVQIRRRPDAEVRIPKLILKDILTYEFPPLREFEEVDLRSPLSTPKTDYLLQKASKANLGSATAPTLQVLEQQARSGVDLPASVERSGVDEIDHLWFQRQRKRTDLPSIGTPEDRIVLERATSGATSQVYSFTSSEKRYWVRPAESTAGRRTYAASVLYRDILGLKWAYQSRIMHLNANDGRSADLSGIYVVSENVSGKVPDSLEAALAGDPQRLADVQVAEFILGQTDGKPGNMHLEDGRIAVFDHNLTFGSILPSGERHAIGGRLPSCYSKAVIDALKSIGTSGFAEKLSPHLSREEFAGAELRFKTVLADLEIRGDAALCH